MIFFGLKDSRNGYKARVTRQNQLVTSPLSYSTPIAKTFDTANQAVNIVSARTSYRIVITSVYLYGDKNIDSATDATVEIYEATKASETTVSKSIISVEIPRRGSVTLNDLNWVTSVGVYLNGKTNDNIVYGVIGAYYIPNEIDTNFLIE